MSPAQPATVDTTGPAPTRKLTWVDFARVYALRGWPVFPVHIAVRGKCSCGKPACTNKGKHPQTAHSFYDATTDEDVIRTWGKVDYPVANIGIRTGKESGLVVLDIDPDKSGEESLRQLEAQHGPLPETATVRSGGKGDTSTFSTQEVSYPPRAGSLALDSIHGGMVATLWPHLPGMSVASGIYGRKARAPTQSRLPPSQGGSSPSWASLAARKTKARQDRRGGRNSPSHKASGTIRWPVWLARCEHAG